MRLTVAICTWNRASLLRQTLEEFTRVAAPAGVTWELLVVNNACTDDTDTVLQSVARRLPIRRLVEPEPGLARSRNLAVREATGDYILWTDDDVLVPPGWLAAYRDAFARNSDAAVFGGPVAPWFAAPPPQWLERAWLEVSWCYAVRECPPLPAPITPDYVPFGANLAVRRDVQLAHPYDPALGRRGAMLYSGEDWAAVRAMLAAGHRGWWVPEAGVRHYLAPRRLTLDYLRRVIELSGEAGARQCPDTRSRRLFGKPLWLCRDAVLAELGYRARRAVSPPERWIRGFIRARALRGQLRAYGSGR